MMKKISINLSFPPKVKPTTLCLVLAVFFTFVYNFALIRKTLALAFALSVDDYDFNLSIPVLPICIFNLVFVVLCIRKIEKYIFSFLMLVSCFLAYAQLSYGIVFDTEMIRNIFETDQQEAFSYFSPTLVLWLALAGVLPVWLLWKTKIHYPPVKREIAQKLKSVVLTLAMFGLIAVFNYDDYATTVRNNIELRNMPVPFYALKSTYKYVKQEHFQSGPTVIATIGEDATQKDSRRDKKNLVVLIIGETQRSMSYQLYGYARPTNEHTSKLGVFPFNDTVSCGTATAYSLPCMFSNLSRKEFNIPKANARENVLDVMARAGVNIVWLDNDGGCKGVCDRVPTVNIRKKYGTDAKYCPGKYCYDEALLPALEETLATLPADKDNLVVLHAMGSHGPAYYERYPLAHKTYKPDCDRSDVQFCEQAALINTYDNTIRYFDYVMSKVIEKTADADNWNAALFFISDHGESLGENDIYLHGLPYMFAPKEQTNIPFIGWMPGDFNGTNKIDDACVKKKAAAGGFSHENLFDTLLGLFDVQSSVYRAELDIFEGCRSK